MPEIRDRPAGPLHAYLAGVGRDGRNRTIEEVISLPNAQIEAVHDFIQWLFPLPTRSMAQPDAPVLSGPEIAVIRADPDAAANLARATERMLRFYRETNGWLAPYDHNHLRITRIITSLKLLAGPDAARAFHRAILARHEAAGAPVNARSLRFWTQAAEA